jgi:hypothetical protein
VRWSSTSSLRGWPVCERERTAEKRDAIASCPTLSTGGSENPENENVLPLPLLTAVEPARRTYCVEISLFCLPMMSTVGHPASFDAQADIAFKGVFPRFAPAA